MPHSIQAHIAAAHRNVHSLLNVLKRQLLGVQREDSPDYELMYQIVDYLSNGSGTCHYPLEEQLYAKLATRHPHISTIARKLGYQHKRLLAEGRALREAVQLILEEHLVLREDLLRLGRRYVSAYRRHMRNEERALFPLLSDRAIPSSSAEDDASLHANRNFQAINDRLVAEGAGPWPWEHADHQHCAACS